jgi:hypothetical protein
VVKDSLLDRVITSAEERHLSQNTLMTYRRTWLKVIAWAAAEDVALGTLPLDRAGEFYEEATRGRSAFYHLQVKAALALLYHVLGATIRSSNARLPNTQSRQRALPDRLPPGPIARQ